MRNRIPSLERENAKVERRSEDWEAACGAEMVFELVKLVTPLQAGIAVVICMALSARHMDLYNKHMEKYAPLGGLLVEKRERDNSRTDDSNAAPVAPPPGLLAGGGAAAGASRSSG